MAILGQAEIEELKKFFSEIQKKVSFDVYLDKENNPETSDIIVKLFEQIKENFGDKFDFSVKEGDILGELGLNVEELGAKGPVIVPTDKRNIVFLGIPSGHEFPVLLEDIHNLSSNHSHLPQDLQEKIKKIDKKLEVLVFITPTCPYCPSMTALAHNMAFLNDNIKGIMVEALEFNDFANKFNVMGVPRTIIRDAETKKVLVDQEGMVPPQLIIENLLKNL
jgi:glutaredoxin-like protein